MMGREVLARMGSRWQTHSLQGEEVGPLNLCINRGGSYSADEEIAMRRAVKYDEVGETF